MFIFDKYEIYNTYEFCDEEYINLNNNTRINIGIHGITKMYCHYPSDQNSPIRIKKIEDISRQKHLFYERRIKVYYENTKPIIIKKEIKDGVLEKKCVDLKIIEITEEEYEKLYSKYTKTKQKHSNKKR